MLGISTKENHLRKSSNIYLLILFKKIILSCYTIFRIITTLKYQLINIIIYMTTYFKNLIIYYLICLKCFI